MIDYTLSDKLKIQYQTAKPFPYIVIDNFLPEFLLKSCLEEIKKHKKWFSNEGQLREKLNESVLSKNSNISSYFNPMALDQLLKSDNTGGMWLMLFLEEWLTQFKK